MKIFRRYKMTAYTVKTLNNNAFYAVKSELENNHKAEYISDEMIKAYLEDARFQLSENGRASFEIGSLESKTGCPVVINLDADCVNEEIEDDDE